MLTQRPCYYTALIGVGCDTAPMGMQDGMGRDKYRGAVTRLWGLQGLLHSYRRAREKTCTVLYNTNRSTCSRWTCDRLNLNNQIGHFPCIRLSTFMLSFQLICTCKTILN